ncbi:hypothetical protein RA27_12545 [Ruegeria sp. ANG-R]|nr:hypothetical protein RA27_12545 [Ruegeria sp. ANG-R]
MVSACGLSARCGLPDPIAREDFDALYATPLSPPESPLKVYHLGHSLVGKDMPAMVAQLAGAGHSYNSQLGWGANLREHWEPDVPVSGFDQENTHREFRDPHEALASGEYDAVILTEALPIRSAIKYQDPQNYLHKWATAAWAGDPDTRVYFYESWHELDVEEGWIVRLDQDLERYWEGEILRRALAHDDISQPIYVIPVGQVMAAFARRVKENNVIGPIHSHQDLFSDKIHFNDYGAYLVALTHYAVLYGRSPEGLPYTLRRADGTAAASPGPEAALAMQQTVWDVVKAYPPSGVTDANP